MPSKAKYNTKQKEAIGERDNWLCIICGRNSPIHFHHVYFGEQSMYTPDRNSSEYGVCICDTHHRETHSCAKGEGVRQRCIDYVGGL